MILRKLQCIMFTLSYVIGVQDTNIITFYRSLTNRMLSGMCFTRNKRFAIPPFIPSSCVHMIMSIFMFSLLAWKQFDCFEHNNSSITWHEADKL